jgi:hypothetical protein
MDLVYNCEAYSKDAKVLAPNGSKPGILKFSIHQEIYRISMKWTSGAYRMLEEG